MNKKFLIPTIIVVLILAGATAYLFINLNKQKEERIQKLQNIKNDSQNNFTPPVPNNGTAENNEEKKFMGVNISNIFSLMNKKTEEGK